MTDTLLVLENLSRMYNLRVRDCNIDNANVGELALNYLPLNRDGFKVHLLAHKSLLSVEVLGVSSSLSFSINRPDKVMGFKRKSPERFEGFLIYGDFRTDFEVIMTWVEKVYISGIMRNIKIGARESLHIYQNAIVFISEPKRNIPILIDNLVLTAKNLPRVNIILSDGEFIVDGLHFNPGLLPKKLRPLAKLVSAWSRSDDVERSEIILNSSRDEKNDLVDLVCPLLSEIGSFVNSFGDEPLSHEAIIVGNLAETALEICISDA